MANLLALVAPDWFINLASRIVPADIIGQYRGVVDYVIWPLLQIAIMLFVVATLVAYLVYGERKISAFIQARLGPMRVGPYGLLQPLADLVKLISKEDFIPDKADRVIFPLAPMISVLAAFTVLSVLPFGPTWLHISDVNIGLLFVLAFSSVGVLGIIMAGWSSNSKYPLLGGLRSSAQLVSYEVGMGLAIVGAIMFTRTLSMVGIIQQQMDNGFWNIFYQPLGFFIFFVCGLAETNRTPFDLPEGESEIVGGFHTEYSGFRWSLFFLSEYTGMLIVSSVATTLYLGGWHLPLVNGTLWGLGPLVNSASSPILYPLACLIVFAGKVLVLIYIFMWFRWTLPRYRYDQLMDLGWKWLTPAALANIVLTGIVYVVVKAWIGDPSEPLARVAIVAGMFIVGAPVAIAITTYINRSTETFDMGEQRRRQMAARAERQARIAEQKA